MPTVPSEVEVVGERGLVDAPVLVGVRGQVRGELVLENLSEVVHSTGCEQRRSAKVSFHLTNQACGKLPTSKQSEVLVVGQRLCCGQLELEDVTLAGVHVDAVNPLRLRGDGVVERVVSGRGDDQHRVVLGELERLDVHVRILPCEAVDVRSKLAVNLLLQVRDSDGKSELRGIQARRGDGSALSLAPHFADWSTHLVMESTRRGTHVDDDLRRALLDDRRRTRVLLDLGGRVGGRAESKVGDVLAGVADRVKWSGRRSKSRTAKTDGVTGVFVESLSEGRDVPVGSKRRRVSDCLKEVKPRKSLTFVESIQ